MLYCHLYHCFIISWPQHSVRVIKQCHLKCRYVKCMNRKRVFNNWWPLPEHWIILRGCHVCIDDASFDIVADIVVWNYQISGWRFKRYCLRLHKCCIYIQDFSNLECKQRILGGILQFSALPILTILPFKFRIKESLLWWYFLTIVIRYHFKIRLLALAAGCLSASANCIAALRETIEIWSQWLSFTALSFQKY